MLASVEIIANTLFSITSDVTSCIIMCYTTAELPCEETAGEKEALLLVWNEENRDRMFLDLRSRRPEQHSRGKQQRGRGGEGLRWVQVTSPDGTHSHTSEITTLIQLE